MPSCSLRPISAASLKLWGRVPRIPFSADPGLFSKGVTYGRKLIDLHALSAPVGGTLFVRGSLGPIVRPSWDEGDVRICEEATVPGTEDAWRFGVSGYRILERWLRRREGLDLADDPDLLEELFQVVGTVGATRVWLAPAIDDLPRGHPLRRFVAAMCMYAHDVRHGLVPGPYTDRRAEIYARCLLLPDSAVVAAATLTDVELADRFEVPLEQARAKRAELPGQR